MSATFAIVKVLVAQRQIRISQHGYNRLWKRGILLRDIVVGTAVAELLEDDPDFHIGPVILVLMFDRDGQPLHAVWGIEAGTTEPAVLVTAYRPNPAEWSSDFRRRA